MDEKDKHLIAVLQDDASATTRQLARKTNLPITTVHNRLVKLKELGVIKKYVLELDHEAMDEGFSVYVLVSVNLETLKSKGHSQYDVARDLRRISATKMVSIVSGGTDIVVFLRTKNVHTFDKLLLEEIQQIEGISGTQSLISISDF